MDFIINTLRELNIWSTIFRVVLAVILGGLIGLERGHHGRAAGLRTHILVCLGATMAALVGLYAVSELHFSADPMRVGAQVVSGIGFLGVGTIMVKNQKQVMGLTTAAGLWATACIGLSIGIGFYVAAVTAFLAVIITMSILVYLERNVKTTTITYSCYVEVTDISKINELYDNAKGLILNVDVIPPKSGIQGHVGLEFKANSLPNYEALISLVHTNTAVTLILPIQN